MLIKAWADMTLKGQITSPPLFLPLPSPTQENNNNNKPNNLNLIHHYKSLIQRPTTSTTSHTQQPTITFHFNQETLSNCITMAGACLPPFEALAALFWTCISKIKGRECGLVDISVCFDARKVLGLDKSFFGSCMVYRKVQGGGLGLGGVQVGEAAAALIRETVSRDEVMEMIEWLEREGCESPPLMNDGDLVCVDLEDVGAYSVVFEEDAMPLRASYYIEPAGGAGQVVVLPSGDGGRVVAVTLPEDEARKLLEDALIQQIAPTVVMGLTKKLS